MANHSDSTFITNEGGRTLLERFNALIENTKFFDVLSGYFYVSGFYALCKSLEKTEKIRILIGIQTDRQTDDLIKRARQQELQLSHAETKECAEDSLSDEVANSEDSKEVEEGIRKFLEWLKSGKLEIKAYPTENIHAKVYIMTFDEGYPDMGRVITGSSNFTQSGLVENLEFNVELKNATDYVFAKEKFEELWGDAVDVSERYIQTIQTKTCLNDKITPYHLYLKFLYEYFKEELSLIKELYETTGEVKELEYQKQAVLNAKKILEGYGGVFISDVVGLGKTYVSALLAKELDGNTLVLAPPALLDEGNPGSWRNVFLKCGVLAKFGSLGKLDQLIDSGVERYKNIFIDEAHRFRTEDNVTYEKLSQICRGKRVVLVTATPLNNTPKDILSQIKLFQNVRKSTIPGVPNLERFFNKLASKLESLDRHADRAEYIRISKENAQKIRESVLKYLMVRRTRRDVEKYFSNDLKKQNFKFPAVEAPKPIYYELDPNENEVFDRTIQLVTQKFQYARYMPLLYYKHHLPEGQSEQSQKNMGGFMRVLLIKRLESSFYAFRQTIERFERYHRQFLKELERGHVYVGKRYANKIFDLLSDDDDSAVEELLEGGKVEKYPAERFKSSLKADLESDLKILKEIKELWDSVKRDPKFETFSDYLSNNPILKKKQNKLIVFTESKETADYLAKKLHQEFPNEALVFTGASSEGARNKVNENFDASSNNPKDDHRILVTTEVLSEGVNLHRSNIVVNYDIPWNPTRLMQRVGRINRLDTKFDKIYSFNFFPTKKSNDQIKLKEAAEAKIESFITLLGTDARLLTDGESVETHELFNRLMSKKTLTGEDEEGESELKYLQVIKHIQSDRPDLFEKVRNLPKKARTAQKSVHEEDLLLTYFRKGKLQKFFLASNDSPKEIDFMEAAGLFEADEDTPYEKLPDNFYEKLKNNKQAFEDVTQEYLDIDNQASSRDSTMKLRRILKAIRDSREYQSIDDDNKDYLKRLTKRIEEGALPKQTIKTALRDLSSSTDRSNPLQMLAILQKSIAREFVEKEHVAASAAHTSGPREVILSEYFIGR